MAPPQFNPSRFAKGVWDTITAVFKLPLSPPTPHTDTGFEYSQYTAFFEAVKTGDWETAKEFHIQHPEAVRARIPYSGKTALHIAVGAGHVDIVKELVSLMEVEDLEIKSKIDDRTALDIATIKGITEMAESMVTKNKKLLSIPNSFNVLPVLNAYFNGHWHMARYLYSVTPLDDLMPDKGPHGATIISECFSSKEFDISWDLVQRCPKLIITLNHMEATPLYTLAGLPSSFRSGAELNFWQQWVYDCIDIQSPPPINHISVPVQNEESFQANNGRSLIRSVGGLVEGLVSQSKKQKDGLVSNIVEIFGINRIYEMKIVHVRSLAFLKLMCEEIKDLDMQQMRSSSVYLAIFRAVSKGNVEFITHICNANPDLLTSTNEKLRGIYHFAIECRQEKIYNLLHAISTKDWLTSLADRDNNNMLHMAGLLSPFTQLNRIPGAALQMQRELQWYKEVETIVPPKAFDMRNFNGYLTPRDLFTKNHSELLKEGEKWMKETATSYTVVGALIITMMFAAVITIPGGNKDTGFPAFIDEKLFMLFIISDAISLFSSTTATLTFLGILTSRYAEDDFLKSLPTKMIIGLGTLFLAIATMMIAFSAALLIIVRGQSWIVIPAILLSSVPVTLFAWMQFPLLVRITVSTYGRGIFNRNMEHWL